MFIIKSFANSMGSFMYHAMLIIFAIVAGLAGIGWAWSKLIKHTGAFPEASIMTREQRNKRFEDFFNRRLKGKI